MTTDDLNNEFPSREGAYQQMMETLSDSSYEPWYSFEPVTVKANSGNILRGVKAISYDELGDIDKTYDFWWA